MPGPMKVVSSHHMMMDEAGVRHMVGVAWCVPGRSPVFDDRGWPMASSVGPLHNTAALCCATDTRGVCRSVSVAIASPLRACCTVGRCVLLSLCILGSHAPHGVVRGRRLRAACAACVVALWLCVSCACACIVGTRAALFLFAHAFPPFVQFARIFD